MATLEELVVQIKVEMGNLKAQMAEAQAAVAGVGDETGNMEQKSNSRLKNLIPSWQAIGAAAGAAALAIGASGLKIIGVAADADATTQKFNTVFKEYAAGTQQWADQYSAAAGRSRTDVMAWASSIQDTLVPMGYSREEAAKMSQQLVQTGVDLGAFYDQADSDVMEKITSGLVGNTENWREWGVVASENAIKQELLNMLGEEGAKNATEAQKLQARLNILLKGTADAQGQAAREADSYQSQIKKLSGQIKDMMAEAGKGAMEKMATVLKRVTDMMSNGGSERLVWIFQELADAVAWVTDLVFDAIDVFEDWGDNGGFKAIEDFAEETMQGFIDVWGYAYDAIQEFVGRGGLERVGDAVTTLINSFTEFHRLLSDIGVYKGLGAAIGFVVNGLLGFIEGIAWAIQALDSFKRSMLSTMADVLDTLGLVVPGASDMADGIRAELARVPSEAEDAMAGFPGAVSGQIDTANTAAVGAAQQSVSDIASVYGDFPGSVSSELGDFPGILSGTITDSGKDGIAAAKSSVAGIAGEYTKLPMLVDTGLDNLPGAVFSAVKEADTKATQAAKDSVLHISQPYETLPGQASRNIDPLPAAVEHVVKIVDAKATPAAKESAKNIATPFGGIPQLVGSTLSAFPTAVTNPIKTAGNQGNAAAINVVDRITVPISTIPGKAAQNLSRFPTAVTTPIKSADVQAAAASGSLVNNAVQKFVPLPSRVGTAVAPIGRNITTPINAASTSSQASAGSMVSGIIARITPLISRAGSVFQSMRSAITSAMSGAVSAVSSLGSSMYSAAANVVQQAINGLNSRLSSLRSAYNTIRSYISGGSSSSSSSSSSRSSGTGSASVRDAFSTFYNTPSRIEVHDTGGVAGYDGLHYMRKGELAIPKQYNWNAAVISPIVRALSSKQSVPPVSNADPVRKVIVTINNNASDVSTLNKTIVKAAKTRTTARTI